MQISGIQSGSTASALASTSAVSKASSVVFDPKDTNEDGIVSASEELAYALQHPTSVAQTSSMSQYNQSGGLSVSGTTASGSLNLFA